MSNYYSDDCECVQGIEFFLDPRHYTPTFGREEYNMDIPIWAQPYVDLYNKQLKEAEEQKEKDPEKDVTVTSEQVLDLVVQGTCLTNKQYDHIVAYQLNTYTAKLETLDSKWLDADSVSLVFTHTKLDESILVPVYELGKPVKVPNEVLIPGLLDISACTLNSDGSISSLVTNSIQYHVYAPEIKPIKFGKITNFDLYFHFISTVKNLMEEVTSLSKKTEDLNTIENLNKEVKELKEELDEYKKHSPKPFSYKNIKKHQDYLYEIWYDEIDYEGADEYFKKNFYPATPGTVHTDLTGRTKHPACTAIYKNGIHGRNYDWTYDDKVSFVTHTPNRNGRYASVGVSNWTFGDFYKKDVEDRVESDIWKYLPFHTVDGINECGLTCNANVVPVGDYGLTYGTNPDAEISVSGCMMVRWILDHYATVDEAVNDIVNNINFYAPYTPEYKEEFHYMISDKTGKCVVLEFINNIPKVLEVNTTDSQYLPWMENFYVYGSEYDPTNKHIKVPTLTKYAAGQERHNLIADNYDSIDDVETMGIMMQDLNYTHLYTITDPSKIWYSEVVFGEYTAQRAETNPEDFMPIIEIARQYYTDRVRGDGKTWQTVHTSIYNKNEMKLYVYSQEELYTDVPLVFNLYEEDKSSSPAPITDQCWERGEGVKSIKHQGTECYAEGDNSIAEGFGTHASARNSHAEGDASKTLTDAVGSHAEGIGSNAGGIASHAEGQQSTATGFCAHAEGGATTAMADYSHSEGNSTVANNPYEHAEGHFNVSNITSPVYGDAGNTMSSIGIGNGLMNRKNAIEVMQNGDIYIIGVGGYDGTNFSEAKTLQEVLTE